LNKSRKIDRCRLIKEKKPDSVSLFFLNNQVIMNKFSFD